MTCDSKLKHWLSRIVFDPDQRLDEILADLTSMSTEERSELHQSFPEMLGFDIEMELATLIQASGEPATAGQFVDYETVVL